MTTDTSPVLKPADVAARLKVSREAAVWLMETGKLKAVNIGRGSTAFWRTSEAWLAEYLIVGRPWGNSLPMPLDAVGRGRPSPVRGLEFANNVR